MLSQSYLYGIEIFAQSRSVSVAARLNRTFMELKSVAGIDYLRGEVVSIVPLWN